MFLRLAAMVRQQFLNRVITEAALARLLAPDMDKVAGVVPVAQVAVDLVLQAEPVVLDRLLLLLGLP
ncbi:MAG: hypothetical protein EBY17_30930 [Acidobacteriia bacterium]|nr:hypothetical protein [Terriglobia bacterium]